MAEILSINGAEVKIGEDDGKVVTTPIAALQFANPKVGDKVDVYRDGKDFIVKRTEGGICATTDGERSINKHIFVWIGAFMFGGFAGWIWTLVDWINGIVKAYGGAYSNEENFTFDENGNYTE